jgi:hypothetical protein
MAINIVALATTPPTTGKQGSLKKHLHLVPDAKIWERGLANEWGRTLPHSIGTNRPPAEQITGTGT